MKKITTIIVTVGAVIYVLFFVGIALFVKSCYNDYIEEQNSYFEKTKNQFETAISKVDNAFSLTDFCFDETYGCTRYYFTYNSNPDEYLQLFIEFCNILQIDFFNIKYPKSKIITVVDENGNYITYSDNEIGTNILLDDYSIFENVNGIQSVVVNNYSFTELETETIMSNKDDYSFDFSTRKVKNPLERPRYNMF